MGGSVLLFLALVGSIVFFNQKVQNLKKELRFETFKNLELKKKLKLSLRTITKMETNPDLVHSRDFNLDYLRMRMDEENFNFAILNQIKAKIKDRVAIALRSAKTSEGTVGIASTSGKQINETLEVVHTTNDRSDPKVLFRIQINLVKLPSQASSSTIQQIIECMEAYLSPEAEEEFWQPTIQGHLATMEWDQKAKPTPLLVLEQTQEGSNVTMRPRRSKRDTPTSQPPHTPPKASKQTKRSGSRPRTSSAKSKLARTS
jgi:hypothetical protein